MSETPPGLALAEQADRLFQPGDVDRRWYVLHAKPRCEKKAAKTCLDAEIRHYLPLRQSRPRQRSSDRRKAFTDNAWKYAAPPVIQQIAEYGRFADAYPAVLIDRDRDLGMSVILINPYMKDIICRLYTHDGRKPLRVRIPSMSARRAELLDFLEPSERRWRGQIQLTANNRVVTYIVWHSLREPVAVSDQEHLDAYRGEPTHIPATLQLRRNVGAFVGRKGAMT